MIRIREYIDVSPFPKYYRISDGADYLWKDLIWRGYTNLETISLEQPAYLAKDIYRTREEAEQHLNKYFKSHPKEFAEYIADRIITKPD